MQLLSAIFPLTLTADAPEDLNREGEDEDAGFYE